MNQTIYFGVCDSPEEFEPLFESEDGTKYFHKITMQKDQFVLEDTCGRYVPMEYDFSKALGTAVFIVNDIQAAIKAADTLYNKRIASLKTIVDHMNDNS